MKNKNKEQNWCWSSEEILFLIKNDLSFDKKLYSAEDRERVRILAATETETKKAKERKKIKEVLYGN